MLSSELTEAEKVSKQQRRLVREKSGLLGKLGGSRCTCVHVVLLWRHRLFLYQRLHKQREQQTLSNAFDKQEKVTYRANDLNN